MMFKMEKKCKSCGNILKETSKYCNKCGSEFEEEQEKNEVIKRNIDKVRPKDSDEYYDRRNKEGDEGFCYSCGAVIKKEAEICPKCGVRNKSVEDNNKPRGSIGVLDG